jgi:hypothetical protein
MRHPFFNMTRLVLDEGEADFHLLEGQEGVIVTLGPNTTIFDRPGRSVSRWPGMVNAFHKSPHPIPRRSRIMDELNFLSRILWGGGDVKFNIIRAVSKQREVLLTAGDGNVVQKINLSDLTRDGAPPLLFLQPAYLRSSSNVEIRSQSCDPSIISWARAPYVYVARPQDHQSQNSILCLSGRTLVWSERLEPGERRRIALGNVIAATENIVCSLQPTNNAGDEEEIENPTGKWRLGVGEGKTGPSNNDKKAIRRQKARDFGASAKILFNSVRAREGFLLCELTNQSDGPSFIYIQLNKTSLYGGSGFLGVVMRTISSFFRWGDAMLRN